jgi:pantetheine-phosphate adenylyltransferase
VRPYAKREADVRRLLEPYGADRFELMPLDDPFIPAKRAEFDAIVVSPDTLERAEEINALRDLHGMQPMKVVQIPFVEAFDGQPISSTRVIAGEIDEDGRPAGSKPAEKAAAPRGAPAAAPPPPPPPPEPAVPQEYGRLEALLPETPEDVPARAHPAKPVEPEEPAPEPAAQVPAAEPAAKPRAKATPEAKPKPKPKAKPTPRPKAKARASRPAKKPASGKKAAAKRAAGRSKARRGSRAGGPRRRR